MASFLSGSLAKALNDGFKGQSLPATLRKVETANSGGLDAFGDPLVPVATSYPCKGFTDAYSAFFKAGSGIPETDLKVCIFAASLASGIRPERDDKVYLGGAWYQIRQCDTDPATALWTCQAFACNAPED